MTSDTMIAAIKAADQRIRTIVSETPLDRLHSLGGNSNCSVFAKLENLQPTGSFKLRGVTNKLSLLSDHQRHEGVVTASTGNHGAATAYAIKHLGGKATVFVPNNASPSKIQSITHLGACIEYAGEDSVESEKAARQYAQENKLLYISPYNDKDIIAGQGTIACELTRQDPALDAVFVALGGGGLISGIAIGLKDLSPQTQIIACSPSNSKVMMESVRAGEILDIPSLPTFSDGTAGGVEQNSITYPYCASLIHQFVEVSELEISQAVKTFIDDRRLLIEGAAGVAIAAYLQTEKLWQNKNIAIVICGGNVGSDALTQMLNYRE